MPSTARAIQPDRVAADVASRVPASGLPRVSPRVLIVDDSAVARAVMSQLVADSGRFQVAGALGSASAAMAFLAAEQVDIILLDIAMPGTDGITALPDLLAAGRGARVVIVSSAADDGTAAAIQALALGAADTVVKPGEPGAGGARFRQTLLAKLERLSDPTQAAAHPATTPPSPAPATPPAPVGARAEAFDVIAIGASTGGIHALGQVLRAIPAEFRQPILVTQHLPVSFMPYFAAQVALLAGRPADVAVDRMRVRRGRVIVAPGDAHLRCVALPDGGMAIRLSDERVASGCTPSVDPMLASLAQVHGARALAVILSGMGRDGAEGARILHEVGGCILAQDRASSVVWGMPGAVAPIADALLSPDAIGTLIATGARP